MTGEFTTIFFGALLILGGILVGIRTIRNVSHSVHLFHSATGRLVLKHIGQMLRVGEHLQAEHSIFAERFKRELVVRSEEREGFDFGGGGPWKPKPPEASPGTKRI